MSVDSCRAFLERTQREPVLGQLLRAVTDTRELVVLGRRHGYSFDLEDIAAASSALSAEGAGPPPGPVQAPDLDADGETTVCHYQLALNEVGRLEPVAA